MILKTLFRLTDDDVLVGARVIDELVATQILLVLDGQTEIVAVAAGRAFFEFDGRRVKFLPSGTHHPRVRMTLRADPSPIRVGVSC